MMYLELLSLTDEKSTYAQFLEIKAAYMARENMKKQQAVRLWNRRYGEKVLKPLAKELREIKQAIRNFQRESRGRGGTKSKFLKNTRKELQSTTQKVGLIAA